MTLHTGNSFDGGHIPNFTCPLFDPIRRKEGKRREKREEDKRRGKNRKGKRGEERKGKGGKGIEKKEKGGEKGRKVEDGRN